ncbi:MAG: hypothetical protein GY883_17695 [Shimia sp.]|nr:hypothetical protein [Shimia sp.]
MFQALDTSGLLPDHPLWRIKVWSQRTWVARWEANADAAQLETHLIAFLEEAFGYAHAQPDLQEKPTAEIAEAIVAGILHSETAPAEDLRTALHKITS